MRSTWQRSGRHTACTSDLPVSIPLPLFTRSSRCLCQGQPGRIPLLSHRRRPIPKATGTSRIPVSRWSSSATNFHTDGGVVEGVWIFSRHGDRTPSRPLTPEHRRAEEAAFWMTKLPIPDSATVFSTFSHFFPVVKLKATTPGATGAACPDTFIDVSRNPFGFLTSKGLQQLADNGQRFFNRYNTHAYHFPECREWRSAADFLSVWDVQAFSTNYLRTICSIQSFLDGMFDTRCYQTLLQESHLRERTYDPAVVTERIPSTHRDYTSIRIPVSSTDSPPAAPLVTVKVRALRNDPLNAFDRNPDLIAELVSDVMTSEDFLQRDGKAAPLAARLANILPGLVRRRQTVHSNTTSANQSTMSNNSTPPISSTATPNNFSQRTPSGINWVEAADHFVCRTAHNVSLSKFSDFETDEVEQTLRAMSATTLAHLSWRFRKWYQHERLLAVIAAPPLREIANQITATPGLAVHERRPFVIYSCHDITILGLLYAIGADFLMTDDEAGSWRFWPPYGCNLVFELVRMRDGPPGPDTHIVRVLLNGNPVRSVHASNASGRGSCALLYLDDFVKMVSKLEDAGGHDYSSLLARI